MKTTLIVMLVVLSFLACGEAPQAEASVTAPIPAAEQEKRFEYTSYQEVAALFEELNYTEGSWAEGNREVPRLFLAEIPERWRASTSKEITVKLKKEIFFRVLAPLVLRANELVMVDRTRLEELRAKLAGGKLTDGEKTEVVELARRYRVVDKEADFESVDLDELARRVDIIPVSLALAQSAEESGWGTSRFAAQGNALFGQWTFDGSGIAPEEKRKGLGNYGIKAFDSPLDSMKGYVHNLNTHRAYVELRDVRAAARAAGKELSGSDLAAGLSKYSERGVAYVESLRSIIRFNRLAEADQAHLADGPATILVPVDAATPAE